MASSIDQIAKLIDKKTSSLPTKATIVRVDGDIVDITLGAGSGVIHHVRVYGDAGSLTPGASIPIQWAERQGGYLAPIIVTGGGGSASAVVGGTVIGDNTTIQVIDGVVSLKAGGVQLTHLAFTPSLSGHTHSEYAAASHTHDGLLENWSESGNTLSGANGNIVLDGDDGLVSAHKIDLPLSSQPANPSSGEARVYVDTSGRLRVLNSSGAVSTEREFLTAARTYYVKQASDGGSDTNDGLSLANAFATIQKAVNTISQLDINGQTVTISVAAGTYTDPIVLKNVVGYAAPGNLVIQGSITNQDTVLLYTNTDYAHCITADGISTVWDIKGFKLRTGRSAYCIFLANSSTVRAGYLTFGGCGGGFHISMTSGSTLQWIADYKIVGAATSGHASIGFGAQLSLSSRALTIETTTANIALGIFLLVRAGAIVNAYGFTYSVTGSYAATGTRYYATGNSVIFATNTNDTFFPGSISGTALTGAQYVTG